MIKNGILFHIDKTFNLILYIHFFNLFKRRLISNILQKLIFFLIFQPTLSSAHSSKKKKCSSVFILICPMLKLKNTSICEQIKKMNVMHS